jgi:hypothetical protein
MKNKFKNVTFITVLLLSVVFSGSNVDQEGQGRRPLALGWFTVSKIPKMREICFDYESTNKKRFEKRPNVCKWLNILCKQ